MRAPHGATHRAYITRNADMNERDAGWANIEPTRPGAACAPLDPGVPRLDSPDHDVQACFTLSGACTVAHAAPHARHPDCQAGVRDLIAMLIEVEFPALSLRAGP